jgi:hypothetical protein
MATTPPPLYPPGATQGPNGQWYLGGALLLDQGAGKPPIISPTNNSNGMPDSSQAGWKPPPGYDPSKSYSTNLVNPMGPNTQAAPQNYNDLFSKLVPIVIGGTAAAITGGALAPAFAGLGAVGAGAASGAAAGAVGTAVTAGASDKPVTLGNVGKGALLGGATGGLAAAASPVTSSLTAAGLPAPLASGLVKGGIGAGVGTLGAGISGGNVGNSALSGGVNGFLSGAVGNATGSNTLGKVAAGLGGAALSPFLGSGGTASTNQAGNMASVNPQTYGGSGGLVGTAPGQGASTDTSLAGTITGALPGLLQGAAGVYGSQNAAEAMTNADKNAIGTQQSTLGNINNIWSTQQNLGQGAQTALGSSLGTNGKPADPSNFLNMPGYQFAVQQGTQAIQRQAAAMGNAYTPNTAEAVGQYVTGTAAQDYNTYIQQLMGAAGLGSTANAGIATPTYQTGANISTLQQNQGQAQASGVQGAANSIGGMFGSNGVGSSLIGAAGKYLGSSSSNSNSSGINYGPNNAQSGAPAPTDANGGLNGGYIDPNGPNPFGDGSTIAPDTSNIGNIDTSSFDYGLGEY